MRIEESDPESLAIARETTDLAAKLSAAVACLHRDCIRSLQSQVSKLGRRRVEQRKIIVELIAEGLELDELPTPGAVATALGVAPCNGGRQLRAVLQSLLEIAAGLDGRVDAAAGRHSWEERRRRSQASMSRSSRANACDAGPHAADRARRPG